MSSYAVLWSDPADEVEAGKLELEARGLRFEGRYGVHGSQVHRVYYDDIEGVHVGRTPQERIDGRPALVLDLACGGPLRIGSVGGVGTLTEIAERLVPLTGRAA